MTRLRGSKAPNLPISPGTYEQRYLDGLTNVQRLYYNQLDNINGALLGPGGGRYLSFPHICASDSTDQYAAANNTPTVVRWNTLDSGLGFTLSPPGSAVCNMSGIFKITYSAQLANTANAIHDAVFWLKINNIDVPNSATFFTVPARKSAGDPSYVAAYSEATFIATEGDAVELWWATELAYEPVGPTDGIYIIHEPAQTSPYAHPAVPSVIG